MMLEENKIKQSFFDPLGFGLKEKMKSIDDIEWYQGYSEDSFMIFNQIREYLINNPEISSHKVNRIIDLTNALIKLIKE